MNVSERIQTLLDDLQGIQIAKPSRHGAPPGTDTPNYFIKADQLVETGKPGNFVTLNYQTVGETMVDCLEELSRQVESSKALKAKGRSPILTRDGTRGS